MNPKIAIYVYASGGRSKEKPRAEAKSEQKPASADRAPAKVSLHLAAEAVIGQRTPDGTEKPEFARIPKGDHSIDLAPGTYRIESEEPVIVMAVSGENTAYVSVADVLAKDDWPDPPRAIWRDDAEREKIRVFVIGEFGD